MPPRQCEAVERSRPRNRRRPKTGWFSRAKQGLGKTSAKLSDGITGLFAEESSKPRRSRISKTSSIESDLGVATAEKIITTLRKVASTKPSAPTTFVACSKSEVERVLAPVAQPLVVDARTSRTS